MFFVYIYISANIINVRFPPLGDNPVVS